MKKKNKFLDNKGITGIDLTVSLVVLAIFSGVITSLMSNIYKNSIEIQKSANAMAYATIILEKVDEKPFEQIDNNFITTLGNEIEISNEYNVSLSTEVIEQELLKKVALKISYKINEEIKSITINKLKIKEIYK